MIGLRRYVSVMFAAAFCSAVSASASDVRIGYSEPLEALSYERASGDFQKLGAPGVQKLGFNAFSRHFDITLTPNHTLLDAVGRKALGPELQIYRGSLADSAGSWVRIVIADGLPRGLVFDGKEMYAIEAEAGEARIFRLADMHVAPGALACGHAGAVRNGAELFKTLIDETAPVVLAAQGTTSEIDIAVVADSKFASDKGDNAEAEMITRMNNVDGIFSSQLGVQINVGRVDVFDSTNDPFTDDSFTGEVVAGNLLAKVVKFRSDSDAQKANGLTHLFTGHALKGATIGVAYVGVLCNESHGVALTEARSKAAIDSLIVAHELGHNFGAGHDGTSGGNCESEPQTFLMSPVINGSDTFSNCSITEMQDDVSRASCITALVSVDVAIAAGAQPASMFLGDSAALMFDVTSAGTDAANDVSVSVNVPAGLTLDRSSTTAGSCTNGAGSVDCTMGSLAAGAGATVTVFLTAETTGLRDVAATVSATGDENAGNNTATIRFTVTEAIDLVASTPAAAQITINQSTTLRSSVENRSSTAASNPVVTIAPSVGLRIDSASWPVGNCTISGGQARCRATSLAANSTQTIEVQVTGVAEGRQSYTVSATADEGDRDTSNNTATTRFTVTEAIDLVASTPAAAQITINQSTTLRPSVENRSSIAASNPVVTIAPSAGLRIDSASWPVGNCYIAGGQARCTATSLAANSTQTIEVQVTGVAEGQQSYTVSVTADEGDRNTSNDSSTSQLNVTAVSTGASGGEDSGGGSLGFAMLLLLFSALVLRFRRRRAEAAVSEPSSLRRCMTTDRRLFGFVGTSIGTLGRGSFLRRWVRT